MPEPSCMHAWQNACMAHRGIAFRMHAPCRRLAELDAERARTDASLQARLGDALAEAARLLALEQAEAAAAAWAGSAMVQEQTRRPESAGAGSSVPNAPGPSGSSSSVPAGPSTPARPSQDDRDFACPFACGMSFHTAEDVQVGCLQPAHVEVLH